MRKSNLSPIDISQHKTTPPGTPTPSGQSSYHANASPEADAAEFSPAPGPAAPSTAFGVGLAGMMVGCSPWRWKSGCEPGPGQVGGSRAIGCGLFRLGRLLQDDFSKGRRDPRFEDVFCGPKE